MAAARRRCLWQLLIDGVVGGESPGVQRLLCFKLFLPTRNWPYVILKTMEAHQTITQKYAPSPLS